MNQLLMNIILMTQFFRLIVLYIYNTAIHKFNLTYDKKKRLFIAEKLITGAISMISETRMNTVLI